MFRGHSNQQAPYIVGPPIKESYSNMDAYPDLAALGAAPDINSFVFFPCDFHGFKRYVELHSLRPHN